jgi:hypothetical protein
LEALEKDPDTNLKQGAFTRQGLRRRISSSHMEETPKPGNEKGKKTGEDSGLKITMSAKGVSSQGKPSPGLLTSQKLVQGKVKLSPSKVGQDKRKKKRRRGRGRRNEDNQDEESEEGDQDRSPYHSPEEALGTSEDKGQRGLGEEPSGGASKARDDERAAGVADSERGDRVDQGEKDADGNNMRPVVVGSGLRQSFSPTTLQEKN